MKLNILYFSSTGNTLWLLEKMKELLKRDHLVRTFDVITEDGEWEHDYDLLGIVYPVWCSDLPWPIEKRVREMKPGNNTKMFLLGVPGTFSGDTGVYWTRKLKPMGYDVYYANHLMLPVNTCFPKFSIFKVPDEQKKIKMQQKALKVLPHICAEIISGKKYHKGRGLIARLGGHGQRLQWYKNLINGRIREMYIENDLCSNCGLCIRMCPSGVINQHDNGKPRIQEKDDCIFCLKCYNLCPKNAVLIEAQSRNINKFPRYKGPGKNFKPILYR